MRRAKVGRDAAARPAVRGDRIAWIDADEATPAAARFLSELEALRLRMNRDLQLGLFDVEAHFAAYAPGASYARHRDRFADDQGALRVLSCVLYLNDDWSDADGGALRIYANRVRDVAPRAGTFVAFLSERFEHEVLSATRERLSIAAWMRRRA